MEEYVEIAAVDCFIGLVDRSAYEGFIGSDADYESLEKRVLREMRAGKILFWGTATPNRWTLRIVQKATSAPAVQEWSGTIHVTEHDLHVVNYAILMDAAQFEEDALNEQALDAIALAPGWYQVAVRQLFNPERDTLKEESLGFELVLSPLSKRPSAPANVLDTVPWSIY